VVQLREKLGLATIFKGLADIIWRAVPSLVTTHALVGIVHGIFTGLGAVAFQRFFDAVTEAVAVPGALAAVYWSLAFLCFVHIGKEVLNGVHNFISNVLLMKLNGYVNLQIHAKASRMEPIAFENGEFLDDINKAREGAQNSLVLILISSTIFTFYLPYFIFMAVYLYSLKPSLALALVLVFVPTAITQFIRSAVFARLEDQVAPKRREFDYYERCVVHREYFKETRQLGAVSFFRRLYFTALRLLRRETWRAELRTNLIELGMNLVSFAGYGGVLYLLVTSLFRGEISVGSFAAVFASVGTMFSIMEEILVRHFGEISKGMGTVRNFIRFLNLAERKGDVAAVARSGDIVLKDVSFTYPGAEEPSLRGINLTVRSGETLAIVGPNGAGKSTLVRLLTGLYLPTGGEVLVDGVSTKELAPQALYEGVSGVFQKYQRYQMTLKENVMISDTASNSDADFKAALTKAELDLDPGTFPVGAETMLSREFDGVDLSGGQWQRVAVARGFYRQHNLIILDEPTAAIDPLEETRIYKQFEEMSRNKTSILVTHRLGSARVADRIVVLDNGEISAVGTHAELMDTPGLYQEMYRAQAQWYAS
jgi:ATP-binding cassette subfamily B protein